MMKHFMKIFSLLLCVVLLLAGLASCEESITADLLLKVDNSLVWIGSETVLTVRISDEDKINNGALFSPEIKTSDVVLPAEMDGMTVSVAYVSDTEVKLTVSGTPGAEISDSAKPQITFKNSAFQKHQLTGYVFPTFEKPCLYLGSLAYSATAEGKMISFRLNVSGTEFDKLDYAIEGLADGEAEDPSKVTVEIADGVLTVKMRFVHQADEEKPIVLVLKEGTFTLRKEIRVEVPKSSFGASSVVYF